MQASFVNAKFLRRMNQVASTAHNLHTGCTAIAPKLTNVLLEKADFSLNVLSIIMRLRVYTTVFVRNAKGFF